MGKHLPKSSILSLLKTIISAGCNNYNKHRSRIRAEGRGAAKIISAHALTRVITVVLVLENIFIRVFFPLLGVSTLSL